MRVLCLGIHGTWKARGADVGEGAAVSRRKEPAWFLELLMGKEVALGQEGEEVCFASDTRSNSSGRSLHLGRYRC